MIEPCRGEDRGHNRSSPLARKSLAPDEYIAQPQDKQSSEHKDTPTLPRAQTNSQPNPTPFSTSRSSNPAGGGGGQDSKTTRPKVSKLAPGGGASSGDHNLERRRRQSQPQADHHCTESRKRQIKTHAGSFPRRAGNQPTRMTRSRIPPERVRGEHVLLLGRLLHNLGAPFPEFFQDTSTVDDTVLVGVIVTGIPLNPVYCVEFTVEWRSSDDYIPLQEAARKAILALRAHFSNQLSGSQFGGIPSIAPGSFGLQFGPNHTSSYPYPPLSPATLAVQRDTSDTMLLASTMLYDSTRGALARAEESSNFWRQRCQASEALRETRHTPTPDAPPYHPTYPTSDPGPSSYTAPPSAPPTDSPVYSAAPPTSTFYPFLADDFIPAPPVVPIPDPSYDPYPTIPSSPYPYRHVSTPPPQGDLGDISAPPPDCPLPYRLRPELHGPRITVHPNPVGDTALVHEIFRTYFGDPSSSQAAGGGASPSQEVEDREESDPEEW